MFSVQSMIILKFFHSPKVKKKFEWWISIFMSFLVLEWVKGREVRTSATMSGELEGRWRKSSSLATMIPRMVQWLIVPWPNPLLLGIGLLVLLGHQRVYVRKTSIQIGQSSGGGDKMPIPAQHPDPYMPMIMENATTFHGPIIKNPFSYHSIVYRSHPKKSDFIPKINVHCVYRISDRISDLANSYVIPSSLDTSDEPQATYDDQGNFRLAEAVRGSIRVYIFQISSIILLFRNLL